MALRHRPMRAADIRECVEMVAAHPVVGPRYQGTIEDLRTAWHRLLDDDAKTQFVLEEEGEDRVRILGAAVSVFVDDAFMRSVKTPPLSWVGPELAKRIAWGESPVLSHKQLQEANSRDGLNLICWETCLAPDDMTRTDVFNKVLSVFIEGHRGYFWKEMISIQAETVGMLHGQLKAGGMLLNPANGKWEDPFAGELEKIVARPHLVGLLREIAMRNPGSLVGMLFNHEAPRFGFSASAQRLLLAALRGGTDEELADELGISLSAVKKAWRAIYDRVTNEMPDLIPAGSPANGTPERAREKRRRLMTYLREHPEELRPVSRKLLKQYGARPIARRQVDG